MGAATHRPPATPGAAGWTPPPGPLSHGERWAGGRGGRGDRGGQAVRWEKPPRGLRGERALQGCPLRQARDGTAATGEGRSCSLKPPGHAEASAEAPWGPWGRRQIGATSHTCLRESGDQGACVATRISCPCSVPCGLTCSSCRWGPRGRRGLGSLGGAGGTLSHSPVPLGTCVHGPSGRGSLGTSKATVVSGLSFAPARVEAPPAVPPEPLPPRLRPPQLTPSRPHRDLLATRGEGRSAVNLAQLLIGPVRHRNLATVAAAFTCHMRHRPRVGHPPPLRRAPGLAGGCSRALVSPRGREGCGWPVVGLGALGT